MTTTRLRTTAPVVVGVDGSHAARLALAFALWEAGRAGVGLVAVHAWQPHVWVEGVPGPGLFAATTVVSDRTGAEELVRKELEDALAELPDPNGTHVKAESHEGDAARVLVGAGGSAQLLVLGRSGRRGIAGAMLGSTVRYVLHHARVPVMVLPDHGVAPGRPRRLVVGYDGEPSAAALHWAVDHARRDGSELVVLHAWSPPRLPLSAVPALETLATGLQQWLDTATAAALDRVGVPVRAQAVHGSPAATLLAEATRDDVLVVGARGRGGFPRLQLGSVALQLAEHAPCPVVVVR